MVKFLFVAILVLLFSAQNLLAESSGPNEYLQNLTELLGEDGARDRLRALIDDGCSDCNLFERIAPVGQDSFSTEYPLIEKMKASLELDIDQLRLALSNAWQSYNDQVKTLNDRSRQLCGDPNYVEFTKVWNVNLLQVHQSRVQIELFQNEIQIRELENYNRGPTNEAKKLAALVEFEKIRDLKLRSLALIAQKSIQTLDDAHSIEIALSGFIYTQKAFDRLVDLNEKIQDYDRPDQTDFHNLDLFRTKKMYIPPRQDLREMLEEFRGGGDTGNGAYMEHQFLDRGGNGSIPFKDSLGGKDGHRRATPEQVEYVRKKFLEYLQREMDNYESHIFDQLIVPLIARISHPHDIMHLYKTLLAEKEFMQVVLGYNTLWNEEICNENVKHVLQLDRMRIQKRFDRLGGHLTVQDVEAQKFLDEILPEGKDPIASAGRSTLINLAPQFYAMNYQGTTNACVGYALAANIDSHETKFQTSPSYAYIAGRGASPHHEDESFVDPFHEELIRIRRQYFEDHGVVFDENGITEDPRAFRLDQEFTYASNMRTEAGAPGVEEYFREYLDRRLFDVIPNLRRENGDDSGLNILAAPHILSQIAIPSMDVFPANRDGELPDFNAWTAKALSYSISKMDLAKEHSYVLDFASFFSSGNNVKNMLVKAISTGVPIAVSTRTDIRIGLEDWYNFIYTNPNLGGHALNVTGFQTAINPWTLEPEDVFIVRDSLNPGRFSQKVPAKNLTSWGQFYHRITEIHQGFSRPRPESPPAEATDADVDYEPTTQSEMSTQPSEATTKDKTAILPEKLD